MNRALAKTPNENLSFFLKKAFWVVFLSFEIMLLFWASHDLRQVFQEMGQSLKEIEKGLLLNSRQETKTIVLHRFDPLNQVFFQGSERSYLGEKKISKSHVFQVSSQKEKICDTESF